MRRVVSMLGLVLFLGACGPSAPPPRDQSQGPPPDQARPAADAPPPRRAEPAPAARREPPKARRRAAPPPPMARPERRTPPRRAVARRRPAKKKPQVTIENVRTQGGIARAVAQQVAAGGSGKVLGCYVSKANPRATNVHGLLKLRLLVRRSGKVGKVKMLRSTLAHAEMEHCVMKVIRRGWKFSRSKRWVRYVYVDYKFTLFARHGKGELDRYVEKPPKTSSGVTRKQIIKTFKRIRKRMRRACRKRGGASVKLTISGKTGRVIKLTSAKTLPRCARRTIKRARFPRFKAAKMEVTLTVMW